MSDWAQVLEQLRAVREELAEVKAAVTGPKVAARRGMTAVEAARFFAMDRKTFYRRVAPLLRRDPVSNRFPLRELERIKAKMA